MNNELHKFFSRVWTPAHSQNNNGGASSVVGTQYLSQQLLALFAKYKISSVFDAGCNDCGWMSELAPSIAYQGGDISINMINHVRSTRPELSVILHDITTDPIPLVDLLFVRDVTIHLSHQHKQQLWLNWHRSQIPWILITHTDHEQVNREFEYSETEFPWAPVNWEIAPWNFPCPVQYVYDPGSNTMALWHRDQLEGIL